MQSFIYTLLAYDIKENSKYLICHSKKDNSSCYPPVSLYRERIVVDHGLELYKQLHHQESDCYKRVSTELSQGCASLELDSAQHIEYAIKLTLCELSLAQLKIPTECHSVSKNSPKLRHCVRKLSHSPQTWTSYSVMICFAIRYPLEKDILEKWHINMTFNQAKNFDILNKQQQHLIQWQHQELALLDQLRNSQNRLIDQLEQIRSTHLKSANQIQSIFETLVLLQDQADLMVHRYHQVMNHQVETTSHQLNELSLQHQLEIDRMANAMASTLAEADRRLLTLVHSLVQALEHLDQNKQLQAVYFEDWKTMVQLVNSSLSELTHHASHLNQSLSLIDAHISVFTWPFQWIQMATRDMRQTALTTLWYGILSCNFYRVMPSVFWKRILFTCLTIEG
ncbi:hypothetical protein BD560DRAFT_428623 [Blakeslea trispora]|nr:hypothetical protein BD560DRAFT_428623 [Blakeslea trispora]